MNGWIAEGSYFIIHRHGPLAQWLEQATHNRLVAGSSPAGATRYQGLTRNRESFCFLGWHSQVLKVRITQAGFTDGMPVKIRVMPDCIVITTQNTRELWGCAEGLSVTYVNRQKMKLWLGEFPGALNGTGDVPVIKRRDGHCM